MLRWKNFSWKRLIGFIHKKLLFDIFQQKKTEERISSSIDLHFEAHCSFVDKHPYRYWFLVKVSRNYIGTLYITNENSIGVQLLECYQIYFETLINQVLENISRSQLFRR